jgi:hypothetical protein
MFGWFKKQDPQFDNLFTIKERLIYQYNNGEKLICADPIVLERNIAEVWNDLSADIKAASSPIPNKWAKDAQKNVLEKCRLIFGVQALDESGKGLTEEETMDLFNHFLKYSNTVKKNLRNSPISQKAMQQNSVSSSTELQSSSNGTDSGSTSKESVSERPGSSPTESKSATAALSPASITIGPIVGEKDKLS